MEKRNPFLEVSGINMKLYMPGTYTVICLQCDYGGAKVEANNLDEAIDRGLKPHDEYHKRGLAMCGGDHLKIFCPDGSEVET